MKIKRVDTYDLVGVFDIVAPSSFDATARASPLESVFQNAVFILETSFPRPFLSPPTPPTLLACSWNSISAAWKTARREYTATFGARSRKHFC